MTDKPKLIERAFPLKQTSLTSVHEKNVRHGHISTLHLWRAGDVIKVDEYLDDNGLRRQELFKRLVQSVIELSTAGSEERSLLESLSNHVQAKGATVTDAQTKMAFGDDTIADSDKEQ